MTTVIIISGTSYSTPADYDDASAVWEALGAGGNGAAGTLASGGGKAAL